MADEKKTTESVRYIQWGRDGFQISAMEFPAGSPCWLIDDWAQRVARNGGVITEVRDGVEPLGDHQSLSDYLGMLRMKG